MEKKSKEYVLSLVPEEEYRGEEPEDGRQIYVSISFMFTAITVIPKLLFIDVVVKIKIGSRERRRKGYGSMLALQSLYEHFKKEISSITAHVCGEHTIVTSMI